MDLFVGPFSSYTLLMFPRWSVVVALCLSSSAVDDSDPLDVTYYRLVLAIDTAAHELRGEVRVQARVQARRLLVGQLDLAANMVVDSARVGEQPAKVARQGDRLRLIPARALRRGEMLDAWIYYHGSPQGDGFTFGAHDGVPMISSYGLPYTAKQWWPNRDTPADKADSADIVVTVPSNLVVASNGRLMEQSAGPGGTRTYHWAVRYPIYPDVVSLAITDYKVFTYPYRRHDGDSLPLMFFVYPQDEQKAREDFSVLPDIMASHEAVFGPYPFLREKYGVAEFATHSYREHQTLPSYAAMLITGDHKYDVTLAHELAHQWFGNSLSVSNWSDVWLNEGFATYATALWQEHRGGAAAYRARMEALDRPDFAGPVYIADSTNVDTMFTSTTFAKGAWVLHMLRHVMGDEPFFRALKSYTSRYAYRNVRTSDFQRECEQSAGRPLGWFFRQWVYGDSRPSYAVSWSSRVTNGRSRVLLTVRQTQGAAATFDMPLDVRISSPAGDTTVVVRNDRPRQVFEIAVRAEPTAVILDPDGWVLKHLTPAADRN